MDRYGEDALDWAPETWRHEVEHDTGAVIPPDNCDRLMAAVVVHEHPHLFYDSVQDFPTLCAVLAGEVPGDPPDLADITWGVFEARLIVRTPPDKFHPHVRGLVTAVAEEEGAAALPPPLTAYGFAGAAPDVPGYAEADDPALFEAATLGAEAKAADLAAWFSARLDRLVAAVAGLPLHKSDPAALAARVRAAAGRG
jgi:hypothetical protein